METYGMHLNYIKKGPRKTILEVLTRRCTSRHRQHACPCQRWG